VVPVEVRPQEVAWECQWGEGKLPRGLEWAMGGGRWRPTANRESPEWRKGAAAVFGAWGARGKGKGGKWVECRLLVLPGRRGREEEQA
jgi:hypothetical protein